KYHPRDASRHPRRVHRVHELGDTTVANALATADRRAHRAVAFEHHHVEVRRRGRKLTGGNQAGRSCAHDENVAATRAHAGAAFVVSTDAREIIASAPTGQGAMHLRHPVQIESSIWSPSRRSVIAAGGQSGKHSPQASQTDGSTIATSAARWGTDDDDGARSGGAPLMRASLSTHARYCQANTLLQFVCATNLTATVLSPTCRSPRSARNASLVF